MMGYARAVAMAALIVPAALALASPLAQPVVDSSIDWMQPPDGLAIGEVTAVSVDRHDHVWILHRPNTVTSAGHAKAAPPVLEFDRDGTFLRGFGGPSGQYEWPTVEHSLAVDGRGHIWVAGSFRADPARADDMLLEFDQTGKFVKQIGRRGASQGNFDKSNLHAPADIYVDDRSREVYVADGYGNRRVIVFDQRTGNFKRMWSAFGAPPPVGEASEPRKAGTPFQQEFGDGPAGFNGVHAVELSRDGMVYVSDRNNQRIQVFTRSGTFIRQVFVDRNMPSAQTASGIAFSRDRDERYMFVADWGNSRVLSFDRRTLTLLGSLGEKGTKAGQFVGPHLIATDSRGALYVAEVQGRRVQRLLVHELP